VTDRLPASLRLKAITPRALLVDADVDEVQLPSIDGLIGIFPGHRPLVTALGYGRLTYRQGTESESYAVRGGYAEIEPDKMLVFTELDEDGSE